jgi:hypothetical protein
MTLPRPPRAPPTAMPMERSIDALGIAGADIGKAGDTRAARMTYLNNLIQETRWNVLARCSEILKMRQGEAPAEAIAFCRDIMPSDAAPPAPGKFGAP